MKIRIQCTEYTPTKAHSADAGWDLYSMETVFISPGEQETIFTGVFLELPEGYEAQIRSRSGLSIKHGIVVINSPGTVDAGYRGEVNVGLMNHSHDAYCVQKGDRIAQMIIQKLPPVELVVVDKINSTPRGATGMGDSGK